MLTEIAEQIIERKASLQFYHAVLECSLQKGHPLAFLHDVSHLKGTKYRVLCNGAEGPQIRMPTSHTFYDFARAICGEEAVAIGNWAGRKTQTDARRRVALTSCAQQYQMAAAFSRGASHCRASDEMPVYVA